MPKFIHAADLHLDSPLKGLAKYEGAPEEKLRLATREALKNLVKLAHEEKVDFVIIAGDIYDGDWKDYNTGLFFAAQMSRLRIPVVVISGNHDAESQITKSLSLPDNVTRLSAKKPETFFLNDFGVAIHGQSFPTRAVDYDMSAHYPQAGRNVFNIGVLHTLAEGQEGHEPYAPCTLAGLCSKGYDYWALGHVHTRALLLKEDPMILFPGNIQGRHARETGNKGCSIVSYEGQKIVEFEHYDLDVVRWSMLRVDAAAATNEDDVLGLVRAAIRTELKGLQELQKGGDKLLAARFEISGASKAHPHLMAHAEQFVNEVRQTATDVGAGQVWVEKVKLLTTAHGDFQKLLAENTPLGIMLRSLSSSDYDQTLEQLLRDDFAALQEKLPSELTSGSDKLDLRDPEQLRSVFADARELLIPRLQAACAGANS